MKRLLIIFLLMFGMSLVFADCRMMIMAGYGNEILSNPYTVVYLEEFLDEFQSQVQSNPDGWALGYYMPGSSELEDIMRSENSAWGDGDFDDFQDIIQTAGAHLVIGHVRNASSGAITIPNPHPFIWDENGIDYSFAHNGTVGDYQSTINGWLVYPFNQLQTDVDSEVYFSWIMQNIEANNWNVLEGLHDAIEAISAQSWNKNFVFSDGKDIYAYRYSIDTDHELCYGTAPEMPNYPELKGFRVIMSEFPSISYWEWQEIPDDALLYYPANGRTVLFKNFSDPQPEYKRSLVKGWNWESMPNIPSVSGSYDAEYLLEDLTDDGITEVLAQYGSMVYNEGEWSHEDLYELNWNELYKMALGNAVAWFLETGNYKGYEVTGYLRPSDAPTLTDIEAYEEYWISYTLLPTQNMDDAFGDEWDNVYSVKSKDWTYMDLTYPEGGGRGSEPVPSMKMRALEFGKGYIVKFKENIDSFSWNYALVPGTVEIPEESKSQSFSYTELADYEAIDIMEIDGVENIQEIGVFQEDVCVGAVVTDELPVQIRAYTFGQGGDLSFQIVEGSRSLPERKPYSVFNFDKQQYESRSLRAGQQSYSLIKLGNNDYGITVPSSKISNLRNFPNPFNPTTFISFSLSSPTSIELNIFNLKGQLVRSLTSGQYISGSHSVAWDGKDDEGKPVSSGLYMYNLKTDDQEISKKMLLLK